MKFLEKLRSRLADRQHTTMDEYRELLGRIDRLTDEEITRVAEILRELGLTQEWAAVHATVLQEHGPLAKRAEAIPKTQAEAQKCREEIERLSAEFMQFREDFQARVQPLNEKLHDLEAQLDSLQTRDALRQQIEEQYAPLFGTGGDSEIRGWHGRMRSDP